MRLFVIALLASLISPCAAGASATNVGFVTTSIEDGAGQSLDVGIWYPTEATPSPQRLGPYSQDVAPGAPAAGTKLPLVLVSHGSGGWFGGHLDTASALARAGFVVAAVTHKGDSSDDGSRRGEVWMRPAQLKRLTDFMLTTWRDHDRLSPRRIGVFGFSAGGFTALVSAGATPDLRRVPRYCETHPETQTCAVLRASPDSLKALALGMPASTWIHDRRIRAAVVAAPALGFAFGEDGLRNVRVPVQLWRAEYDAVLPDPDYADAVRGDLPTPPDFHLVRDAGHYDFIAPCTPVLAREVPDICAERPDFDRAAFHRRFNRKIVEFFRAELSPASLR